MNEREAIGRLQQGDIGGLEVLVRAYQMPAMRVADLIVRDRALAEDVVQTAFVRAFERIGQFDATRPFGPWFLRLVARDAAKAGVRTRREMPLATEADPPADLRLLTDPGLLPEELAERQETREAVWAALGRLTPAQRAAIVQRYYLGLTEAEMVNVQHAPAGTVKWRLSAARTRLRALLHPLGQEG
jgi:RNA polymerase sigma-70 factor, ECF subfamily